MSQTTGLFEIPLAHRIAKGRLMSRIGSDWTEGSRLPPIPELARLINSGQRNTGIAVQELVRDGWLVSQRRLGTFVAKVPDNPPHRDHAIGTRIALYRDARSMQEAMVQHMVEGFVRTLEARGPAVEQRDLIYDGGTPKLGPVDGVDAFVFINPNSDKPIRVPAHAIVIEINTGLISPVRHDGHFDRVTVDQEQCAMLVGKLLVECGHDADDVCCIGVRDTNRPEMFDQTSISRLWGIERVLGRPLPADRCLIASNYGEFAGARMVKPYMQLKPRPAAIFATSDELAVGFVKGASALDLHPGRDFQIIGFDGQQRGREMPGGPLTTVAVPSLHMGRRAAELLIDRIANPDQPPRQLRLGGRLITGNTVQPRSQQCAPPPNH